MGYPMTNYLEWILDTCGTASQIQHETVKALPTWERMQRRLDPSMRTPHSAAEDHSDDQKYSKPPQRNNGRVKLFLLLGLFCLVLVSAFAFCLPSQSPRSSLLPKFLSNSRGRKSDPHCYRRKCEFMERYKDLYSQEIDDMVAKQRPEVEKGEVYLDFTGASLAGKDQLMAILEHVSSHLYGNSHSVNPSSIRTDREVEKARRMVLDFFNASPRDYSVIFTSGATGGLKIVGETFPWSADSEFVYMKANHNSVLGIREYALQHGGVYTCTDIESLAEQAATKRTMSYDELPGKESAYHLFAFPATCNFSGKKFPLDLIESFHNGSMGSMKGRYLVMLDAAAFVPTAPLDLTKYPADFVPVSFYKMFGFPSGLGCLLVRNEAAELLKKTFFSGGTVVTSTVDLHYHKWRARIGDRFEDGTLPFLNIITLKHGFDVLKQVGMETIKQHTYALAHYCYEEMRAMRHRNGQPVFKFYGDHESNDPDKQGPIINFNCFDPEGAFFDYYKVAELASDNHLHIRSGCSCNPGACYGYLHVPSDIVQVAAEKKQTCGDEMAFIDGKIVGSLRVSLGYLSRFEDIDSFLTFLRATLLNRSAESLS
eukprot:gnl/Trimastix_PCT/306.p1 GENE.gnl/Trimastix_PCT/306~~gnl/Trimastix_PCT/306.p1  ORF type:complete len:596 (+),score=123.42 gnl/Trimastix_PCT/306:150-1937(+)